MVGWRHRLNGHEFDETLGDSQRTGKPNMLQPMGLQRVWHDLATEQQQWWACRLPVHPQPSPGQHWPQNSFLLGQGHQLCSESHCTSELPFLGLLCSGPGIRYWTLLPRSYFLHSGHILSFWIVGLSLVQREATRSSRATETASPCPQPPSLPGTHLLESKPLSLWASMQLQAL